MGGFDPKLVLRWYLEMYVDAHDWVMAANVIGMVLHADGGYMATKPYAAGAGYINKMSNYCSSCRYRPEQRTGPDACPFQLPVLELLCHARRTLFPESQGGPDDQDVGEQAGGGKNPDSTTGSRFLGSTLSLARPDGGRSCIVDDY